jgi:predicted secreted protein
MKKFLLFLLSISIISSLVACGKTAEKEPEIAKEVAETVQKDTGTPLPDHKSNNKREGQSFSIVLNANPTTGFDWILSYDGEGLLNNYNNEQSTPPKGIAGAGLQRRYFFKGDRAGRCNVIFTYKRNWEGGDTSTILSYTFDVDDKMNIKYISSKIEQGPGHISEPDFYNSVE